ncbi:MAG: hypothetical protein M1819_000810 [Sarea resinae]|nr:MAG: hypothetical protein M1819_000810 [Sarea resinae]
MSFAFGYLRTSHTRQLQNIGYPTQHVANFCSRASGKFDETDILLGVSAKQTDDIINGVIGASISRTQPFDGQLGKEFRRFRERVYLSAETGSILNNLDNVSSTTDPGIQAVMASLLSSADDIGLPVENFSHLLDFFIQVCTIETKSRAAMQRDVVCRDDIPIFAGATAGFVTHFWMGLQQPVRSFDIELATEIGLFSDRARGIAFTSARVAASALPALKGRYLCTGYAFSYDDVNPSSENSAGVISDVNPQLLTITVGGLKGK